MDALAAAIWYAVTVTVIGLAWRAARHLFPVDSRVQIAMHVVILTWTWIVLASCALGASGLLGAASLASSVVILATATWLWSRHCTGARLDREPSVAGNADCATAIADREFTAGGPNKTGSGDLRSAVSAGSGDPRRTGGDLPRAGGFPRRAGNGPPPWTLNRPGSSVGAQTVWGLWLSVAAVGAGLVVIQGLMRFPSDWDTLMYHRPLVDLWLQSGSLYVPKCAVWHAPGSNELLGLWWAAPFSGDFWVGLMNVPAGLLLVIGTFELAGRLGVSGVLRHGCALAAVGNSVVLLQITNAKNDVAAAGLFVAGLAYGLRSLQEHRRRDLLFAGAALGLLAGVKYYALGYAGAAWLALTAMCYLRQDGRRALRLGMVLAAVMAVAASYWYARNWWATGTPFYPLGYSGANVAEVESRLQGSVWGSSFLGNGRSELAERYVDAVWRQGGPCQTAAILALPFAILWLLASAVWTRHAGAVSDSAALRAGLVLATIAAWLNFSVTPFTVDPENERLIRSSVLVVRFSLVPLTLSVMALSVLLLDFQRWAARRWEGRAGTVLGGLLPGLFAATALGCFCRTAVRVFDGEWLVLVVALDVALVVLAVRELPRIVGERIHAACGRLSLGMGLALGMVACIAGSLWLSQWWHAGFARHYDVQFGTNTFSRLEATEGPLPSMAALPFRYYPFFGSRRQFDVHRPLRVMSLDYLFGYLVANEIDLVAVVNRGGSHPETVTSRRLTDWLGAHEGAFEKMEAGFQFDLYHIERERLTAYLSGKARDGPEPAASGPLMSRAP